MQSHEAAKLPYVFKPHIFEGQSLRSPFKRFHYDSRIYSLKVLEASVGKHLFCRKRGGCQLLQDGEIKRKIQNLSLRADDQIAVLTSIFNKFLKCRMRRDDSRLRKYICIQLKVLLSFTCGKHELFDPVHLFKIVECLCKLDYGSFHAACSKHYSYDSSGHLNLRRENVLDFERIGLKQISFFGELLYCCASVDKKFNSLFVILTKPLTKKQSELVNEISTVITPNLSLLVFIALRNWIIYYRPFWDWELTNFDRSCPDKKLKQFKEHFSTFLMCKISGPNSFSYTTSYASSIFQFLKNKYFKDSSFQVEYFDHIPDVMLEKEYYHDRTGKNIPELFALSNILDFIIVDSWPRDPPIDYFRICKEIERNVDHNTQMRDYCIFPFVGLNNR